VIRNKVNMPILILQQVEHEPASLIEHVIHEAGWETHTIMTMEDLIPQALVNYSGLVVMGGHMSANDVHLGFIQSQISLLEWCIRYSVPVLGICLGAQLLAKAAGGEIIPSPVRELGWYRLHPTFFAIDDPLFGEMLDTGLDVFQWHGETFTLPETATLLATNPDVIHQAFKLNARQYGIQFHAEITEPLIHEWIEHGTSESAYLGDDGIKTLLEKTPKSLPAARSFCRHMINQWLALG